jgi:urease accessory protein UreF
MHFNIDLDSLSKFYIQSFISNLITVCVKHIPISQKDGQSINVMFINKIQNFLHDNRT